VVFSHYEPSTLDFFTGYSLLPFNRPNPRLLVSCAYSEYNTATMVLGPTARKWLPYLNFTVAASALLFQTTMLYPWHEALDAEFQKLKKEHVQQLQMYHEVKLKRLEELERRVLATERKQGQPHA